MVRTAREDKHPLDFSQYTFERLAKINESLQEELVARKQEEMEKIRAKLKDSAEALGLSVEEIMGIQRKRVYNIQPTTPRYQGPNGELWSGKGPAPKWMKPLLNEGRTKESFRIAA